MTPRRRRPSGSSGSSGSTRRPPGGDGAAPSRRTGTTGGAGGVGTHIDGIDTMAGRLDATRGRVDGVASTVAGVNLGPQSMGIVGSGFTGAAQGHLRTAEQHITRTTQAVDQAQRGTRATAQAYRDTDNTNATNVSRIDSTTNPPTTHPAAATTTGASPSSLPTTLARPRTLDLGKPANERDYYGNPDYRASDIDRAVYRKTHPHWDEDYNGIPGQSRSLPEVLADHPELRGIPEEDLVAIRSYTGDHVYRTMNNALRQADIVGLDTHDHDIRLATSGLNQLPAHDGWVNRGVTNISPERAAEIAARYTPGSTVTEAQFTSTDLNHGFPGGVQMSILSHNGRDITPLSHYAGTETEILFPPGTRFEVLDRQFDTASNMWRIVLEEAP